MTAASKEEYFMREALKLARKGAGRVSPNPMVGAVIVKRGKIIGTGYHRFFGGPHAEINALETTGKRAQGADLYVTLEPCSHFGQTPPCTEAIIRSGIQRVFVGMTDPNPSVNGRGIRKLKRAGISVCCGILTRECERLNESFIKYITQKVPFVTLKSALSLDGKIAAYSGDSKWITCETSRKRVHRMRYEADAVMAGVGTVIADDPLLNVRLYKKAGKDPFRIIVDSGLKIPLAANVLQPDFAKRTMLAVLEEKANTVKADKIRRIGAQVLAVPGAHRRIDLKKLLKILAGRKIASILLEGGSEVNGAALDAGIVDKVILFYAPKIIGGKKAFGMVGGRGKEYVAGAVNIDRIRLNRSGSDFFIEGYVV